ncbi:uncharacterized protein TNCV_495171 [Trichonephila clavipes]|nr:uncharacterized protein TNCV_495171 [Trichonephila clavipes]
MNQRALCRVNSPHERFSIAQYLVVRASDSRPEGLGSMLDVTKYPPSAHGFTCRNCGGGDRGVAIYGPFAEVSLSLNRTVTCMVLKANDRRTSCPCHDEFRGPRPDYVRQVALATTTTTTTLIYIKYILLVGIKTHHFMQFVSSPLHSNLCALLPRQDVQPDGEHWAIVLSYVDGSRNPYGEASVAQSGY